mmetsp:Transcript_32949/g.98121  ORF Transcript_32949/g.98121 Transcript_32949/m.98121 type:complete len:204 (+) Transcript_32949:908-1519(+)
MQRHLRPLAAAQLRCHAPQPLPAPHRQCRSGHGWPSPHAPAQQPGRWQGRRRLCRVHSWSQASSLCCVAQRLRLHRRCFHCWQAQHCTPPVSRRRLRRSRCVRLHQARWTRSGPRVAAADARAPRRAPTAGARGSARATAAQTPLPQAPTRPSAGSRHQRRCRRRPCQAFPAARSCESHSDCAAQRHCQGRLRAARWTGCCCA